MRVPNYLKDHEAIWNENPKQANTEWFRNAKWGLFLHYGLYSQMGRGEWVMHHDKIPVTEYEKLYDTFNPSRFDADYITDLALEAEMSYVNLTACHHEGFCLWESDVDAFNSFNACKRDLVRELAEQCDKKGLGFFTYYTHLINWRHPHAMTGEGLEMCRPPYPDGDPRYVLTDPADNYKFWEYAHACMKELLELEYPLAGMWLDIIMCYYKAPEHVPIEDTYNLISELRPEALISFKQGATGSEDFASPEHSCNSLADQLRADGNERGAALATKAWERNRHKHNEICTTLQKQSWGYNAASEHHDVENVWGRLANAIAMNCNLLANTGPLPDGSIHEGDAETLRAIGKRIREQGWPTPDQAITPDSWTKVPGAAQAQ